MRTTEARRRDLRDRFQTWTPLTLDAWLDQCASAYGDRPLVITDDCTLSYREVADTSRVLADGLAALGVRPGDRVGMLMANYPEFVPLKFAIARTGAVAIPFNYLYQAEELGYVLAQSECNVLVAMTGFLGLDYPAMLDSIVPGWDRPGFADREPGAGGPDTLRHVVMFETGSPSREGALDLPGLVDLGRRSAAAAIGDQHAPGDIGDMLYTSGSTGSPKGVLVTHDAVLRTAYASALTRAYDDGRRILFSLPCYHMFGYVEGLLSVMYVGGAIIPQTAFSAEGYLRGIERHRATDILCVPTMAVALVESPLRHEVDLSSLEAILCGSAPAPVWLWEQIERDFGVSEIVTGYGMTECGGAMTLTLPEDCLELTSTTVGRPKLAGSAGVPGTDVLVVYGTADPETGEELAAGEVGELFSEGPTTMIGFYNKPDETAKALRGRRLYSGDLGRVRPDGYLALTGRSKELYKSGGELVMPKEIEDLLVALPEITQAFAIGLVDERWGEIGCVFAVLAPGAAISEDDVIAHCKQHLARFKVPRRVAFLDADELPKTPTGKVQKFRLAEMVSAPSEGISA
jgi:fatty-acyl-CoA synthase